jgi:GDP-L-fucose synthase
MNKKSFIYVAGHNGLVGSAIIRKLREQGYENLVVRSHQELDLCNQQAVVNFFAAEKPEYVFLAAAKVGGIWANNTRPAEFIYDNLLIEANIIHNAYRCGVKKLLFLGSSCIYPKLAPQPLKEEYLFTGELEPTNSAYAMAKITGIEMCRAYNRQYGTNFISVMPTNLYGPNDNFDLESSHVFPALIRKFHEARVKNAEEVIVWGTGTPIREFLHVDDLADACLFLVNNYNDSGIVNIGCGEGITIRDLALLIKEVVGFKGRIVFDSTKPDGTLVKINDISKLKSLGWQPRISLRQGIVDTYQWYLQNLETL